MAKAKAKKKKTKSKPRTIGADGRTNEGKFTKGNQCSVGNKSRTDEKAKALKQALLEVINEEDIKEIFKGLAKKAKAGDVAAAKEIFDRLWGRAKQEVDFGENTANTLVDIVARMCGNGKIAD